MCYLKYSEELLWILDEPGGPARTLEAQNQTYQIRKTFVHELGLKCDSVGWCKMDLSNSRTPEVLGSISKFCKENGWKARCLYTRKYADVQSDWYELIPADWKDNTLCDRIETVTEEGKRIYTCVIHAYHELCATPKEWGEAICLPERFRNFCIQNNPDELDFCWVKDKGKYQAEQYFHVYGKRLIPRIAVDYDLKMSNTELIAAAGGWLPEIANVFHELQQVNFQDCYLEDDLPDGGIVYAHIPSTFSTIGRYSILFHKDIVQALLQQKILPLSSFRPAAVFKSLPGGYSLKKTQPVDRPTNQFMDTMLAEYNKLKNIPRPIRMVSEKDALKILRFAKKERKGDFQKALPKSKVQTLLDTDFHILLPYYSVSNGCFLSDEYEFLSVENAMKETKAFQESLSKEELLDIKLEGIVVGRCPDGDAILVCNSGAVVRFSHEAPVAVEEWPNLAQFIVEAINE